MKKSTKFVSFLLDETGSMHDVIDDTIGGFNAYVETLKKDGGDIAFSLVSFDSNRTQRRYVAEPIDKVSCKVASQKQRREPSDRRADCREVCNNVPPECRPYRLDSQRIAGTSDFRVWIFESQERHFNKDNLQCKTFKRPEATQKWPHLRASDRQEA